MNKKSGLFIILILFSILSVVDAAWIISYRKTIVTNVTGEQKIYTISKDFDSGLLLDTSNGPNGTITIMEIEDLIEKANMSFEMETKRINLTSKSECDNEDDCNVTVTYINNRSGIETRVVLSLNQNLNQENNFTLLEEGDNWIEYKIQCIEDSCPQRINSSIILEQIPNSF